MLLCQIRSECLKKCIAWCRNVLIRRNNEITIRLNNRFREWRVYILEIQSYNKIRNCQWLDKPRLQTIWAMSRRMTHCGWKKSKRQKQTTLIIEISKRAWAPLLLLLRWHSVPISACSFLMIETRQTLKNIQSSFLGTKLSICIYETDLVKW